MLVDSAKIQEEDAAHLNIQRQYSKPWVEPLYSRIDVDRVLDRIETVGYESIREIRPGVRFRFLEAGHVLGSAMIHVVVDGEFGEHTLTFTGDLAKPPLLRHTRRFHRRSARL
jgi:metallo-beta-lactamase family protein